MKHAVEVTWDKRTDKWVVHSDDKNAPAALLIILEKSGISPGDPGMLELRQRVEHRAGLFNATVSWNI